MIDRFHSSLITSNVECMDIAVDQFIDVKERTLYMRRKCFVFAQLTGQYHAFWAAAVVGTGHKDLFQVIADIDHDDQMASVPDTIATRHFESTFTVRSKRA